MATQRCPGCERGLRSDGTCGNHDCEWQPSAETPRAHLDPVDRPHRPSPVPPSPPRPRVEPVTGPPTPVEAETGQRRLPEVRETLARTTGPADATERPRYSKHRRRPIGEEVETGDRL